MQELLLIDDDGDGCLSLARALKAAKIELPIHAATSAEQAMALARSRSIAVVVLDLSLDERRGVESGFELLQQLLREYPYLRVIILTGHGGIEHGVRALTLGAANFLEKPAHIPHLAALINDGIAQSALRQAALKREVTIIAETLVGSAEASQRLREAVRFAAQTSQSIFLAGETGAGKGLCASLIHRLGKRSGGNFVRYQPNFGSADLVNSDLFGHRKGAFTGATDDRRGLLSDAD
ncbi:MAG: sigma-54-dependent Fis family transcriptional regulator, partial [Proteobacteria bacterium]|nr:sigma-54-dependent Fis family transcriptional regulator [Pseudomonadota bacterium]